MRFTLSSKQAGEGDIRRNLVEADLVECIVALPAQLFYTTGIPVCLWFLTRDKTNRAVKSERPQRDRRGEVLFIDARRLGSMIERTLRELSVEDIRRIADTYHAWRGEPGLPAYADVAGFCAGVTLEAIREHDHVLNPGRYVGIEEADDDGEPLDEKIARLTEDIRDGFEQRAALQERVLKALAGLGV